MSSLCFAVKTTGTIPFLSGNREGGKQIVTDLFRTTSRIKSADISLRVNVADDWLLLH